MLYRSGWKMGGVVLLVVLLASCNARGPEERLQESLTGLQDAIEARDPSAVQHFLTDDFIGNGGIDRRQVRAMAAMLLARHPQVGATFGPLDIDMQPPANATVAFDAIVTGGSGGLLPESAQAYEITTAWRDVDGEWRMYHAEWMPRL